MLRTTLAALALTATVPTASTAADSHSTHRHAHHRRGCNSARCDRWADRAWERHHPFVDVAGPHYVVDSTCYHEGSITASGASVYVGEVANNFLPLGTRIRLDSPAFGLRDFVVEDHIGSGSELDIYGPSESACSSYGRETRGFSVIVRRRR